MIKKILTKLTTTLSLIIMLAQPALADIDQHRPEGISDAKWTALRSAVQEAKLLPSPEGVGGEGSYFGRSVSLDGNRALIGGPGVNGSGAVFVMDYDGTTWSESAILVPSDGLQGDLFGTSVSLSGDRALIGKNVHDIQGFVYVFDFDGSNWNETVKLSPADGIPGDYFGFSVSLLGDRALIGAFRGHNAQGVNESGAAYVFDFDGNNWSETTKLTASDAATNDNFGVSVSLSTDRVLIGAPGDDDFGISSGSAYIFEFDDNSWNEITKLNAVDGARQDSFGQTVSLSGDRVLVGASHDDDQGSNSGSAYVFEFDGNNWTETFKLTASDGASNDFFAHSMSLSGNRALIGAYKESFDTGAVYVFDFDGNTWSETTKLTATDGTSDDYFGYSVSLSGNQSLIGAWGNDDQGSASGSAYVFDYDTSSWDETQKLLTVQESAVSDLFGYSVSLSGSRALIGAYGDNDDGNNSGSAYIFEYDGSNWIKTDKLNASDGITYDSFGFSVSLSGNRALIGAPVGFISTNKGAVYVFDFDGNDWVETEKLRPTDVVRTDLFGWSVSLSGNRALIGAFGDDDQGNESGAAYVYDYDGNNWNVTTKLVATDGETNDNFGYSVSLLGDRALIGAYMDSDQGTGSGSAYIFDFDGNNWSEITKLTASDAASNDNFGNSVSLSVDRVLIGAYGDDDHGTNTGSAYIFDFDGSNWSQTVKITDSGDVNDDRFGISVSLLGDRALIGAAYLFEPLGENSGAAYVFDFDGSNWTETTKLTDPGISFQDQFGHSVSLSSDHALVGSYNDDDHGTNSGSALVFNLSKYFVGGTVTGLAVGNSVVLQNNLGDGLNVDADGNFVFVTALDDLSNYSVTVLAQPTTPNQTCEITGGSNGDGTGTVDGDDVTDLLVTCEVNQYLVDVVATGLLGTGLEVTNGADVLALNGSNPQTLSVLDDESDYDVDIIQQPQSPNQICSFTSPDAGTLAGDDVTVNLSCDTLQYAVGVNVSGLAPDNSLAILNNGTDDLAINGNGSFTFDTSLDDGSPYAVTVLTQPTTPNQICTIIGGSNNDGTGTLQGADTLNITVSCVTNRYPVGLNVTGLAAGNVVVLQNNGTDDLEINSNGFAQFSTPIEDLSDYLVTVINQPTNPNQTCQIANATGQVTGDDVTSIAVSCVTNQYFIGGFVQNLFADNFMVIQNNAGDDMFITQAGAFVFNTPLNDNQSYAVSISHQPDDPIQNCVISNASGNLQGADVDGVVIQCDLGDDLIFRDVFEGPKINWHNLPW